MSQGTARSNALSGAKSKIAAPTAPPAADTQASLTTTRPWPANSGREPAAAPTAVNTKATVFVTFAVSGGSPTASRAGYDTSEARLATTLTMPATTPAATKKSVSGADKANPPTPLTGVAEVCESGDSRTHQMSGRGVYE